MELLNVINRNIVINNPIQNKEVCIYTDVGLPKSGWLNGCYSCDNITSNTNKYKSILKNGKMYDIRLYICKSCHRRYLINYKKYMRFMIYCKKNYKKEILKIHNIDLFDK